MLVFRFYFLGDDDLLEVLGQASSLGVIQAHLKKLFAGIHRVSSAKGCLHAICDMRYCTASTCLVGSVLA
jgi:hypothetical protein